MQMEDVELGFNIQLERPSIGGDNGSSENQDKAKEGLSEKSASSTLVASNDGDNNKQPRQLKDRLPKFIKNSSHPGICVL